MKNRYFSFLIIGISFCLLANRLYNYNLVSKRTNAILIKLADEESILQNIIASCDILSNKRDQNAFIENRLYEYPASNTLSNPDSLEELKYNIDQLRTEYMDLIGFISCFGPIERAKKDYFSGELMIGHSFSNRNGCKGHQIVVNGNKLNWKLGYDNLVAKSDSFEIVYQKFKINKKGLIDTVIYSRLIALN